MSGDSIKFHNLSKDTIEVADQVVEKVVSDTEIILKDPGAHVHSHDMDYEYTIIPKVDQGSVYRNVWDHLGQEQGAIGIFPEGGSHDNSEFLPLKAGVALMALGTTQKYGKPVTIIPCGLKYFKGH